MSQAIDSVIEQLRAARQEHVDKLQEWLRIPSVSTDSQRNDDVRQAGEFIRRELAEAGFETEMTDTAGHPIVSAEWLGAADAPTMLVYGHYDVQPPEPLELWRHGAFNPVIEGNELIARGATDDKGQCLALVRGIAGYLKQAGKLPINVKLLIEGEEEIGSPNLEPYIAAHKEQLAADVVLIADCSQFGPGVPAITVGLRGLCYMEVQIQGPNRDLHSGSFGGSVENPGHVLARIFGQLKDDEGRITIPGFYDDVRELSDSERQAIAALPFDGEAYRQELGVPQLHGESGYTPLEHKWARPTLDVNGMLCGWTGEGAKTVLPAEASGKFSMRLVPDQDPDKIRDLVIAYLEEQLPAGVTMQVHCHHGAEPILVPTDSPYLRAASRAVTKGFGKEPVLIREGGSIPVVSTFRKLLGIDSILLGLGLPDDNAHSPNEKFNLDDYQRGIETVAHLLEELTTPS